MIMRAPPPLIDLAALDYAASDSLPHNDLMYRKYTNLKLPFLLASLDRR